MLIKGGCLNMSLQELKNKILTNTLDIDNNFYILIAKDEASSFIAHEYLQAILKLLNLDLNIINTLKELPINTKGNMFTLYSSTMNFISIDKITFIDLNDKDLTNCFIITNSVDDDIRNNFNSHIFDVGKVEKWQILEYCKTLLPNIEEQKLKELCECCKYSIYDINSELQKVVNLEESLQEKIFNSILEDRFTSRSSDIFELINAIGQKSKDKTLECLIKINPNSIDSMALVTLLKKQFKNVIDIQLGKNVTADSLKISSKQFNAIKYYNCGKYSPSELIDCYKIILNIDYLLKTGILSYNNIFDYVILHISKNFN